MLRYLVVLLLAGAALVVMRWLLRRPGLGRRTPFPWISTTLLLVLAVAAAVPVVLHVRQERALSAVASQLAEADAVVRCQGLGAAFVDLTWHLGEVKINPDGSVQRSTLIKRDQCRALGSYTRSDHADPSSDEVIAVHVLTHEAMHMRGQVNEASAECAAVQRDAWTARMLGADADEARALAARYWQRFYPTLSVDYLSPECRPGGSLDERRSDAPWEG